MQKIHNTLAPLALFLRAFGQIVIISFVPLQLVGKGDHQYFALGFIYALPFVMQLVAAPLWGRVLDRVRLPGVLAAIGFLGYAGMEAGTALAPNESGILIALVVGGAFGAALSPAAKWQALRIADGHRALASALRGEAAGWLVGAILPAVFAAMGRDVFQLLGLSAIVTALAAPLYWGAYEARSAQGAEPVTPPAKRLRLPLGFWLLFSAAFIQFLIGETFYAFYGVYLTRYLGGPLWLYSGSIALTTALGLLLYGTAARTTRRSGPTPILLATSAVYIVTYGALALFPSIPMAAIVFSIPAFSYFRTAATLGLAHVASDRSGAAMGILDAGEGLASSIGGPVAGLFVANFSLSVLPLLPLVLSVIAPIPLLLWRRAQPVAVAAPE